MSDITCSDTTKPHRLPAGYELADVWVPGMGAMVGLCVPQMGMHAVDSTQLESSELFEKTMVVGYYQRRPIFLEPMITKKVLLRERSFTLEIPAVPDVPAGVRFPGAFTAVYDSSARAYKLTFTGFAADTT